MNKNTPVKNSSSIWRSILTSLKQQMKFLSPVRCLVVTRDSYVRGMNNFAASGTCTSLAVQGPHMEGLSRNASRSARDDGDDLYQLIRAASGRDYNGKLGDLGGHLPRSVSVHQEQNKNILVNQLPRSATHSGIPRFQVQKTILESTQEE